MVEAKQRIQLKKPAHPHPCIYQRQPRRRPPLPPGGSSVLRVVYCFALVLFGDGSSMGMVFVYDKIRSTYEGKSESTTTQFETVHLFCVLRHVSTVRNRPGILGPLQPLVAREMTTVATPTGTGATIF